jgi:hypothetical protein
MKIPLIFKHIFMKITLTYLPQEPNLPQKTKPKRRNMFISISMTNNNYFMELLLDHMQFASLSYMHIQYKHHIMNINVT